MVRLDVMKLPFYSDSVNWPRNELAALCHLVDEGDPIGRATFMRRAEVGLEPLRMRQTTGHWAHADALFGPWPEAWDYHVSYHVLPGWPVVWFCHSAIEYVFSESGTIKRLSRHVYDLAAAA